MVTGSDVIRMEEQRDVDGLIRVLQSDSATQVRVDAALALGRLGNPRARTPLQNALTSGDLQVMGAASSALGQLEAKIATKTGAIEEKQAAEDTKNKQGGCAGKLWQAVYWVGVFILGIGCLTAALPILSGGGEVQSDFIVCTGVEIGLGILLLFIANRFKAPKQAPEELALGSDKEPQVSEAESMEAGSVKRQSGEARTDLVAGDVLAMAIVYEGHVIEEPDATEIAQELLTAFSEAGVLTGVTLHPNSAIRIRRADEKAWYQGDYEPGDELPQMLDEGIAELRNRLLAEGQPMGKVNTRTVKLQSRSRVVSTCWVGIHILS